MKIINYEKKKIISLTDEEKGTHENQKNCYICENEFCTDKNNEKEFKLKQKARDHCHYTGNIEELPIVFAIYVIKYQERCR